MMSTRWRIYRDSIGWGYALMGMRWRWDFDGGWYEMHGWAISRRSAERHVRRAISQHAASHRRIEARDRYAWSEVEQ